MSEQIFTNYRLVLSDQEIVGTLVIREGRIADIQTGVSIHGQNGDLEHLLPGLIELHTDTLESCAMPRVGVHWPYDLAVVQQDRMMVGSGITTACNALAVRDIPDEQSAQDRIRAICRALQEARNAGRLLADHRLHFRCETTCRSAADIVGEHSRDLAIVSLMDHRPGQRQFTSRAKLNQYYFSKYGLTEQQVDAFLAEGLVKEEEIAANRKRIAAVARDSRAAIASHDDANCAHVQEAVEDGATICEFPTSAEAVEAAAGKGLSILMGAPNLILGRSHSGNLSTLEVAQQGRLQILSSDYAPHSLLPAIFRLKEAVGMPLYEAARLSTLNPAMALGEDDFGEISIGKRANFLTCRHDGAIPRITSVVFGGTRVA